MRSVWRTVLGLDKRTVVEEVEFDQDREVVVVRVRPSARFGCRCGVCGRRCPGYDQGQGRRRWRGLDLGEVRVELEAQAPRVACPEHGVVTMEVPWARHGARSTRGFEDTVAWLATKCSQAAVSELMRVAWRTVGAVICRVVAEIDTQVDRLEGLRRIGIDEISYRKGQNFLTVVVDHDTGLLVWAAPGRDEATLEAFFDLLGAARAALITHVSADLAPWIARVVTRRAPQAVLCADPFHVVKWATLALEEVRRQVWRDARSQPDATWTRIMGPRTAQISQGFAREIAHSRWALRTNSDTLTDRQQAKLAWIAKNSPELHRAYLLKEGLRFVFQVKGDEGRALLDRWLGWAQRSRLPQFVDLGRRIRRHRTAIDAVLDHGLSNALTEAVNTRIRLITRVAFGFHSPDALIALAMLSLGGYRPALPGR